jgi:hypothetical protein
VSTHKITLEDGGATLQRVACLHYCLDAGVLIYHLLEQLAGAALAGACVPISPSGTVRAAPARHSGSQPGDDNADPGRRPAVRIRAGSSRAAGDQIEQRALGPPRRRAGPLGEAGEDDADPRIL